MNDAPAIERLIPRLQLVERMSAWRRRARARHRVSPGHRPGGDVESELIHESPPPSPTKPGQASRRSAQGQSRAVLRPHLLVAEHQHLPRSALGTRPGDLWRGSVSHRRRSPWPLSPGCRATIRKFLKLVATAKHFAVHSGPECSRHSFDVAVDRHDLRDTYLPASRPVRRQSRIGDARL